MRLRIVLAMFVMLSPSLAFAQSAATLAGVVLADSTERPIVSAEVMISGLTISARSDSLGGFVLKGIPAGRHQVVVRAIGFAEFRTLLTFRAGERQEADLLLTPTVQTLTKVDVTAAKSTSGNNPRIAEFDERKKIGIGHFLTQDYFEKGEGRKLPELLIAKIPGLRTETFSGRRAVASTRGKITFGKTPKGDEVDRAMKANAACYVQVIVDDIVRYGSKTDESLFDIDQIDPSTIAAIEYYTVAQLPLQFNRGGNAPCGALVIWSRWGPLKK